eukprot:TRINITY_DN1115_c1_g2_i8.p1 TRINITY_DN1115_c1_g2~~TRINITY_DN1115_c1_g2_i8.p1  ORF type:complete len:384 (+),score=85.18 TRINITY_DN1115_c1_g2_i8:1393-2544(+)
MKRSIDSLLDDIDSLNDDRFNKKFAPKGVKKQVPVQDSFQADYERALKKRKLEKEEKPSNTKTNSSPAPTKKSVNNKPAPITTIKKSTVNSDELFKEMDIIFGKSVKSAVELPKTKNIDLGSSPIIETVDQCLVAVKELSIQKTIGVDCEWITSPDDQMRGQELCLVQISDANKKVYLFDIFVGGAKLFTDGKLKDILENTKILKIFHDCRWDSDVLWNKFNVKLTNVFDTQIGYAVFRRQQEHETPLPASLNTVLKHFAKGDYNLQKEEARKEMEGKPDYWKIRPMTPTMLQYSREDVLYLPLVYRQITAVMSVSSIKHAMEISQLYVIQRRDKTVEELEKIETDRRKDLKEGERPIPCYGYEQWDRLVVNSVKLRNLRQRK